MKKCIWLVLILGVLALVACGTAKGRYDGEDLEDDDDAGDDAGDDVADDDNDDAVQPEIEDYTWIDADGNEVHLYDFLGKVVLLNTAAFWCEPCREETPSLQKDLWEEYQDEDFQLIQLIVADVDYNPATPATATAWRDEFGVTYLVCADPDYSLQPYFLEQILPFNMLLSRDFSIELRTHEYDKDILSLMIEDLL